MDRICFRAAHIIAVATLAACGEAGGPSTDAQVNFNVATRPAPATSTTGGAAVTVSAPETFTDGVNTLIITQVQLVLREIELKRVETTTSCDGTSDDRCERLEVGPVLLDLPLGTGGAARSFSVAIDTGTFHEVEFEIHKPSDDDASDLTTMTPITIATMTHAPLRTTCSGTPANCWERRSRTIGANTSTRDATRIHSFSFMIANRVRCGVINSRSGSALQSGHA